MANLSQNRGEIRYYIFYVIQYVAQFIPVRNQMP